MTFNGQVVLNSLIAASFGNLMAMAVAPTYRLFRYFDLSLAGIALIAGYTTAVCVNTLGWPVTFSVLAAITFTIIIHVGIKLVLPALLQPKANSSTLLLASLGIYICIISMLSLVFGTELVAPPSQHAGRIVQLAIGRCTYVQGIAVLLAIILPGMYGMFLNQSRLGMAIRAAISSIELAEIAGIRMRLVSILAVTASAFFASLAGALLALDVGLRPTIGLQPILLGVVAVIVGVRGGLAGIGFAALSIALLQNLIAANWGPHWQDAITFFILLTYLLIQPKGVFCKSV